MANQVPADPNISRELRLFLDDLARAQLPNNYTATADPTVTDDVRKNWSVGSRWINLATDKEFVCVDTTAGAAVWKQTTP